MLLVSDLDLNDLHRSRTAGSVTPRLDRRPDLFQFLHSFPNPFPNPTSPLHFPPLSPPH
ncbi:MAG: hypothetical protein LR011_02295 [Verrucomicrobia bacterium]|nr:hypothetical protein [Verrucomicrobiota bacterium]